MIKRVLCVVALFIIVTLASCGNSSDEGISSANNDSTTSTEDTSETTNEETTETENAGNNTESTSMKAEYLEKLNTMKAEIQEQIDNSNATTTVEMMKEAEERYEAWDQELNNIYLIVQEQLSDEEKAQLTDEQRTWIVERDNAAKEASQKFEGGTAENLEYTAALANETEKRCFELVENYME